MQGDAVAAALGAFTAAPSVETTLGLAGTLSASFTAVWEVFLDGVEPETASNS